MLFPLLEKLVTCTYIGFFYIFVTKQKSKRRLGQLVRVLSLSSYNQVQVSFPISLDYCLYKKAKLKIKCRDNISYADERRSIAHSFPKNEGIWMRRVVN